MEDMRAEGGGQGKREELFAHDLGHCSFVERVEGGPLA